MRLGDRFGDSSSLVVARWLDGGVVEPAIGLDPLRYAAAGGSLPDHFVQKRADRCSVLDGDPASSQLVVAVQDPSRDLLIVGS